MTEKPRRLGRGLEALLGSAKQQLAPTMPATAKESPGEILLTLVRPNRYQPRRDFAPQELAELEASMRVSGLLQPIAVREVDDHFELIAGERRFRAAVRLGWEKIPAVIRDLDDQAMLTLALVENLQRADLNPMEEADGYQRLIEEFGLTQQQVADTVGKERSTVANLLRLRQLPPSVRTLVQEGKISAGHARALLALPNEKDVIDLALQIVARQLTVRDVEQLTRKRSERPERISSKPSSVTASEDAELRRIIDGLRRYLQTDVSIVSSAKAQGEIRIRFYSAEDLERLIGLVCGNTPYAD